MEPYSVILKDDVAVDPRTYGPLLAPALGVTVLEARMAVRRGSGILAENLPEDEARRLAESLEADGIACWCAPSAALPPLPAPRRATSVETTDEGLRCALLNQLEPATLPWDRIGVVSIGLVLVPELDEIAGVRKKDVAAVARREREQRDLVRDRLLAVLNRIDLTHMENAPAAGAHHYFFDQLRRKESKQLKAFTDVLSDDGAEWWRIPLEESNYKDGTNKGLEAANYMAAPVVYARRKGAHTERSLKLFQGGNVERLAFDTMEDFHRYTRWWMWRERLRVDPDLALPSQVPASGGNGRPPRAVAEMPGERMDSSSRPGSKWRSWTLVGVLTLVMLLGMGLTFEKRGADCMICRRNRRDDVIRLWGISLKENRGAWITTGRPSPYDVMIGLDHEHLYDGFGYEREGLLGIGARFGRTPVGNASPAETDAAECANALFLWHDDGKASVEEVRNAYSRLFQRVRSNPDAAGRQRWLDLARAPSNREAPVNLLSEASK